jgi:hypothetical protein
MSRGKGVRLQRYKDGGVRRYPLLLPWTDGLTWEDSAGRAHNRNKGELTEWIADRAQAGRLVPKGFPRSGPVQLTIDRLQADSPGFTPPIRPKPGSLMRRLHHVKAENQAGNPHFKVHVCAPMASPA